MDKQELINIMKELNLTQRAASELLCVNIRTVRRWINGESKIRGSSVVALRALRFLNSLGYGELVI